MNSAPTRLPITIVTTVQNRSSPTKIPNAPVTIALTWMLEENHSVSSDQVWPWRSEAGTKSIERCSMTGARWAAVDMRGREEGRGGVGLGHWAETVPADPYGPARGSPLCRF